MRSCFLNKASGIETTKHFVKFFWEVIVAEPSFSNIASVLPKEGYQMCFPVNVTKFFRVTTLQDASG